MDDFIKQKLSGLLDLLRNPGIKSKQAAFNAYYGDLTQVKEIVSWEKIVEVMKQETGITFDARTASNMYGRTRRKIELTENKIAKKNSITSADKVQEAGKEDKQNIATQKKVSNPGDLRKLRNRPIDLDDLKEGD
ncbi:hypothetical protein CS369_21815 (plasmid) [Candidatus Symbiopectobacterium sp. 'North America']|uniref:hypothetical protein n=1 Tax=Candidatus Symbiopectobacterium sp. 'North America' TaxID=2794574 RepID=UPI0018CB8AA4|nr:hypothetical protein [Candidatus Symbiopectobacterium sp. 'North America']MBG6246692.1 hypothetical protein [Candidatus Symbiopectobacterium sp. 'North America']